MRENIVQTIQNEFVDNVGIQALANDKGSDIGKAVQVYLEAIEAYESEVRFNGGISYSIIEEPKIKLADAVLRFLRYPTAPKVPDWRIKT